MPFDVNHTTDPSDGGNRSIEPALWQAFGECWLEYKWVVDLVIADYPRCSADDVRSTTLERFARWYRPREALPDYPKAFLRQITRNVIIDAHRKIAREVLCAPTDTKLNPETADASISLRSSGTVHRRPARTDRSQCDTTSADRCHLSYLFHRRHNSTGGLPDANGLTSCRPGRPTSLR